MTTGKVGALPQNLAIGCINGCRSVTSEMHINAPCFKNGRRRTIAVDGIAQRLDDGVTEERYPIQDFS